MSKTQVDDIDRNIYDIKNKDDYEFKMKKGLNREIVEEISAKKNDPDWMKEIRLKALETYEKLELPTCLNLKWMRLQHMLSQNLN